MFDPGQQPLDPAPAGPSIHPSQRFGALAEVLLCSGFPTQVLLIAILGALGMPLRTSEGTLSSTFVISLTMADTALLLGLIVFFLRSHREPPRDVLLGHRRPWREALLGLGLLPLMLMFVVLTLGLILTLAPHLHNVPRNPFEDLLQTPRDAVVFGIVAMVAGGLREEVQRAFIVHRFDRYLGGGWVGIVLHSGIFGLGHLDQGFDAAIVTALLGVIWGWVYLRRRSVVAPMVSHALYNLVQLLKYLALA